MDVGDEKTQHAWRCQSRGVEGDCGGGCVVGRMDVGDEKMRHAWLCQSRGVE